MIEPTPDGILITVRVIPRAGRSGLAGTRDGALLVRLNAPPVEGAANAELIDVLADALNVPKRAVAIISGERSRTKRVRVTGVAIEKARELLSGLAGP
jgi:uncharacterized protein (TIGR00251 family)